MVKAGGSLLNQQTKNMKTITIKTYGGDRFETVAKNAQLTAINDNCIAEFEFNGVQCLVDSNTNLDWLWRDYNNAHRMEWKTVGTDCLPEYPAEVQKELDRRNKKAEQKAKKELDRRNKKAEQKAKKESDAYNKKANSEKALFDKKTTGIKIDLLDQKAWDDWKVKNTDGYGNAIFEYAEGWAKLMQIEISKGKSIIQCAEQTSFQLGFLGITGFMYGAAVAILSQCWRHGEELRKWHNKEYGHEGDGVVNPAILTISK
jgi:hypothetical protein